MKRKTYEKVLEILRYDSHDGVSERKFDVFSYRLKLWNIRIECTQEIRWIEDTLVKSGEFTLSGRRAFKKDNINL